MEDRMLSEDDLRNILTQVRSPRLREAFALMLTQMSEIRSQGGSPLCVVQGNGKAYVFDNTELMGN